MLGVTQAPEGRNVVTEPEEDVGPAVEAAAWRVSEWDVELWIDLVALLNQLLSQAGGEPITLASVWDRMPPHAQAFVEKVSTSIETSMVWDALPGN